MTLWMLSGRLVLTDLFEQVQIIPFKSAIREALNK